MADFLRADAEREMAQLRLVGPLCHYVIIEGPPWFLPDDPPECMI